MRPTDLHKMRTGALFLALGVVALGCSETATTIPDGGPAGSGGMGGSAGGAGGAGGAGPGGAGGQAGTDGSAGTGGAGGVGGTAGASGAGGVGGTGGVPLVNEKLIPIVCDSNFRYSSGLPPFASVAWLEVFPTPITSDQPFTADIRASMTIPAEVLQREVDGAFPEPLASVEVGVAQAELLVLGVQPTTPTIVVDADLPKTVVIPQVPGACPPDACPNVVTEDVEIELGSLEGAPFTASPGGQTCFDVNGDLELFRFPVSTLRTSVRVTIDERERPIECAGGTPNDNGTPDFEYDDWVEANHTDDQLCFPIACPEGDCNACPSIDVFGGGPRSFIITSVLPRPRAELVFRVTDPDDSGLTCRLTAFPESGFAEADFFNPLDTQENVGPVLMVSLDELVEGVSLPGLGGDDALPPLELECGPGGIEDVIVTLTCFDGDPACEPERSLSVFCGHGDYCIDSPVDCRGSNDCMTDGVCDMGCPPQCDPSVPSYDPAVCDAATGVSGAGTCERCPGRDRPAPAGTPCSSDGGTTCDDAGNCI